MRFIRRIATGRRLRWAAVAVVALAGLAVPLQAVAGAQVPLKGADSGTWGEGSHACGALFPVFVTTAGVATHVGRYAYSSQECVDFGTSTYAGVWQITAANGDPISGTYAGSFTIEGAIIAYEQENTVTGGTGRFAGGSGSFHVSGLASLDDFSDTQVLRGWISSPGAAHS